MDAAAIQSRVAELAERFAADRPQRQSRRYLDPQDFADIAATGYLRMGVAAALGGLWTDTAASTRPVCEALRTLAHADPSVALVAAMHPGILSFWMALPDAPAPYTEAWAAQRRFVADTALDGCWWGTITSEPGSGGDVMKSKATARPLADGTYALAGAKHFGSGSGVTSFMITTAVPEGESIGDWFFMDWRGRPWDGSAGLRLTAEWDGYGMIATQSHAFQLDGVPGTRMAWPGNIGVVGGAAGATVSSLFLAVIVGVVQTAVALAREQIGRKRETLRAFDQVEWARIENEAWLIDQAYEGVLRAIETRGAAAGLDALHGKTAVAQLAESVTSRICRVVGGGSFHRASPFGAAFEDVRALGFLRPPWPLAFDAIFAQSLPPAP